MPLTTLNDIQRAVFERTESAQGLLPLKFHRKKFDHGEQPYTEVIIAPSDTRSETIGSDTLTGFIVFNVYFRNHAGAYDPAREAQKYLDLFPKGLVIGQLEIISTGVIRAPVEMGVWDFTPVLIEYEADSCRH